MNRIFSQRISFRFLALCLAFLFVLMPAAGPAAAHQQDSADLAKVKTWLESHVPEMMREAGLPGFSLAVVRDGRTIYAEGFGARDPKKNLPATPDTLYGIGSLTKSFVAIAVMQLIEQGKLTLDDQVSRYVPLDLGLPGKPITIRHLMKHSPGFPNLGTSTILLSRGLGSDTGIPLSSAADFYRFVNGARDEIIFGPGEHYFYSNASWRMLGHIIQTVSGIPFHRYVKDRILDPLEMTRSTLDTAALLKDDDHLVPHRKGKDGPEATPFPYPNPADNPGFSFVSAAGGIASSASEMTRYLNVQIEQGRYAGGHLASPEAFTQMQTMQIETGDGYYGKTGYGYGLGVTPGFLGHKMISHGGSISVSTAHMAFIPDLKIGIVMMGNGPGMAYGRVAESVFALMMGLDPEDVLPVNRIEKRMNRFVGSYSTYRKLETLKIYRRDGMLYMGPEGAGIPLIPEDPAYESLHFFTLRDGLKSPIEFRVREDGSLILLLERNVYHKDR